MIKQSRSDVRKHIRSVCPTDQVADHFVNWLFASCDADGADATVPIGTPDLIMLATMYVDGRYGAAAAAISRLLPVGPTE